MVDAAGLVSVHGSRGNQQSCVGECDSRGAAPRAARGRVRGSFEAIETQSRVQLPACNRRQHVVWPHVRF